MNFGFDGDGVFWICIKGMGWDGMGRGKALVMNI